MFSTNPNISFIMINKRIENDENPDENDELVYIYYVCIFLPQILSHIPRENVIFNGTTEAFIHAIEETTSWQRQSIANQDFLLFN